jgi:hypothetical protein
MINLFRFAAIAAIAVGGMVFAACGGTSASPSASSSPGSDASYIAALDQASPDLIGHPSAGLIAIGHGVCTGLGTGLSVATESTILASTISPASPTPLNSDDMGSILVTGVDTYCSQYAQQVLDFINAHGAS